MQSEQVAEQTLYPFFIPIEARNLSIFSMVIAVATRFCADRQRD
jgi:hypothetical protein